LKDVVTGTFAGCEIGVGKVLAEEAWRGLSISDVHSGLKKVLVQYHISIQTRNKKSKFEK
jgi:hypothetical protein